ncbi:aspartyl-phosphate phosphatase Spo0E family protein [Clostridium sp.]|uniref:aspartyl-phosphate phosphatase Spo0E family protein n=1 Tax=Clostridium sp. TaxID=1506 RepID=UPI0037BE6507
MERDISKDIDYDDIDTLRDKLNTLMSADYKSSYDEVLTISTQLDKLIHLSQTQYIT